MYFYNFICTNYKVKFLLTCFIYLDILAKINRTTLNTWYELKSLVERIESLENAVLNNSLKKVFNDDLDGNFIK